ncbi:Cof-type HAD-IIB family hydrolase [Bacillus weihaiensis]|uniref:Cof-type HAD-IIB family hydrolase n=1 Tax=Bacillus weihaiensis TaxID=1547283 RepID=UPI00235628E4|nr:Cof-type HAD-IIB family hydrolase [Bacillus weihaiensis]
MTRLIAIDLDGTLLNHQNEISKENLEAIKKAQQEGIEVVIATGRAHFDVLKIFEGTELRTWIIGANGATIHSPDGTLYHSQPIERQRAYDILKDLEENGYYYEVFTDHCIYTPQNGRELLQIELDRIKSANPAIEIEELQHALTKQFSQHGFCFVPSFSDIDQGVNMYNLLAFSFSEEKVAQGFEKYGHYDDLTIVTSAQHNFELEHKNASKGIALKKVAHFLQIPLTNTIAIGDSMNDVSMLQIAGTSVAMGNARDEVKEISDYMTSTNDEHGVAKVILKLSEESRN